MKIFKTFQRVVCFSFPNSNWTRESLSTNTNALNCPFNLITFLPWLHVILCFILNFVYIFFGAKIFQDYSDCIYAVLASTLAIFNGMALQYYFQWKLLTLKQMNSSKTGQTFLAMYSLKEQQCV